MLFGFTLAERARQTGLATSTVYRKVTRFEQLGMRGFLEAEDDPDSKRVLPQPMRRAIIQLKSEYPAFRPNELATICHVRFNRCPSAVTIKKILATESPPTTVQRRFPRYAELEDSQERRGAIVRLHAEGWNIASIAAYLETSRPTVYATLKRWIEEGIHGLADKPLGPKQPVTKTTLWAMNAVRKLQQNPELGEFRIHAALDQLGIKLSPRTCGRILARNRKLYGLRGPDAKPREPKGMPFKAAYRHQYWTTDIRYLDHQLGGGNVYCISILENYSRAMVASAISRSQALPAFLNVLFAALRRYGAPETLVSDGGSVFRAGQAMALYRALGITHQRIDPSQPWQSYIETNFNVQRRMADWDFSRAQTWEELQRAHERWLADFNYQVHWAHQKRTDGRRSPADVLGWATGKPVSEEELNRIFTVRAERSLDQQGYARFRNWRIYGERGLSRKRVVLWLCDAQLRVEFGDTPLAEYRVVYRQDHHHLRTVDPTRLYETQHQSSQLPLLELEPHAWRLVMELPAQRQRRRLPVAVQPPLFVIEAVAR
ncbi:MAG: helix-turn-helix domain-containing protein [Actinobacteria bacterium]|nr:helix-turn-helix domain-containing protein [Actinomycetota bacterium]